MVDITTGDDGGSEGSVVGGNSVIISVMTTVSIAGWCFSLFASMLLYFFFIGKYRRMRRKERSRLSIANNITIAARRVTSRVSAGGVGGEDSFLLPPPSSAAGSVQETSVTSSPDLDDEEPDDTKLHFAIVRLLTFLSLLECLASTPHVLLFCLQAAIPPEDGIFARLMVMLSVGPWASISLPTLFLSFFVAKVSTNNPLMIGWPWLIRVVEHYIAFEVDPIIISLLWTVFCYVAVAIVVATGDVVIFNLPDSNYQFLFYFETYFNLTIGLLGLFTIFYFARAYGGRKEYIGYAWFIIAIILFYITPAMLYTIRGVTTPRADSTRSLWVTVVANVLTSFFSVALYLARSHVFKEGGAL